MYYLTYESNLNYVNMILKFPTAKRTGFINLKGYRLVYKGVSDNFSYLTLEPSKGDYVPMGVYQLKDSDILNLDMYEGPYKAIATKIESLYRDIIFESANESVEKIINAAINKKNTILCDSLVDNNIIPRENIDAIRKKIEDSLKKYKWSIIKTMVEIWVAAFRITT